MGKGNPYSKPKRYRPASRKQQPGQQPPPGRQQQSHPRYPAIDVSPSGQVHITPARMGKADNNVLERGTRALERGNGMLAGRLLDSLSATYPLDFRVVDARVDCIEESNGGRAALEFLAGKIDTMFSRIEQVASKDANGKKPALHVPGSWEGNNDFLNALERRGHLLMRLGDHEPALDAFLNLLDLVGTDYGFVKESILHLAAISKRLESVDRVDEILARSDHETTGARESKDEEPGARHALEESMNARSPREEAPFLLGCGLVQFARGNVQDARALFARAIRRNPYIAREFFYDDDEDEDEAGDGDDIPETEQALLDSGRILKGSRSEAVVYGGMMGRLWARLPGALDLLGDVADVLDYRKLVMEREQERIDMIIQQIEFMRRVDELWSKIGEFENDPRLEHIDSFLNHARLNASKDSFAREADQALNALNCAKELANDIAAKGVNVEDAMDELEIPLDIIAFDVLRILNEAGKIVSTDYYRHAIRAGEELLASFPTLSTETRRWIADAHFGLGDMAKGEEIYGRIIADDPENVWGHIAWGDQYATFWSDDHPDFPMAEKHYMDALAAYDATGGDEGDREVILDRLLTLYTNSGDADKAARIMNELPQKDPSMPREKKKAR